MATYLHRAYDPGAAQYVYWTATALDLAGSAWIGPPAFSTLIDVAVIRVIPGGADPTLNTVTVDDNAGLFNNEQNGVGVPTQTTYAQENLTSLLNIQATERP
jgi:hypothetical protein